MSRRHHGNRPHRQGADGRPSGPVRSSFDAPAAQAERSSREGEVRVERPADPVAPISAVPVSADAAAETAPVETVAASVLAIDPPPMDPQPHDGVAPAPGPHGPAQNGNAQNAQNGVGGTCTAPQLRRFIKSRPYVPMHELRRRFGIIGDDDDVSAIDLSQGRVYVGLPAREGSLIGELLRGGDIGYELSLDPRTPVVIGLYPMRPVARN
jgi:hypothetical protein